MDQKIKRARHGAIDESYWDGLDNAAKIIPAITTARSPNVFRLTAVLRSEVDPVILQEALEQALAILPAFAVKMHRGLFWYYFDQNNEKPLVREEKGWPCAPIWRAHERGFLFRVTYFHRRINFDLYHVLSDGMGATNFLRVLICCYYNRLGHNMPEEMIRRDANEVMRDFDEDSFNMSVPGDVLAKTEKISHPHAYQIGGYRYDGHRLGVLCAVLPTDQMLAAARNAGATLSEYLTALLIWSIYNTSYRRTGRSRPIVVNLPVNLRAMFGSATLRNFFGFMNVAVLPARDESFEGVLEKTKQGFRDMLNRGNFERQIADNVRIERIPGIRFVPRVIKDFVMRTLYKKAMKRYTVTFSNIGRITLPDCIASEVERLELLIGGSETHAKKTSVCSYGNELAVSFSSTVDDNSIERFFVSFLTSAGIAVSISSNETPAPVRKKKEKKEKNAEVSQ